MLDSLRQSAGAILYWLDIRISKGRLINANITVVIVPSIKFQAIIAPTCSALAGFTGVVLLIELSRYSAQGESTTSTSVFMRSAALGLCLAGGAILLAWRGRGGVESALRFLLEFGLLGLWVAQLIRARSIEPIPLGFAIGFLLIVLSLWADHFTIFKSHKFSRGLAYLVFALAWSVFIFNVYSVPVFISETAGDSASLTLLVAGFLVVSAGLIALHADHGLPRLLTQQNLTAFQFRTLLPAVLLLPLLIGLLVIQGLPWYEAHMAVALTAIGSALIATLILMVSTITLQSAEQKLRQFLQQIDEARIIAESANDSRDNFVNYISHELRAPLSSALSWVELLELDPSAENLKDGIEVIKQSIVTQVRLIDDLGEVAQATSGQLTIEPDWIDLVATLRTVCAEAEPQLSELGVRLRQEIPYPECIVMGDSVRIQQVFRNLLSNAGKYNRSGGMVCVRLGMGEHVAAVTIEDDGPGLTGEDCEKIFEPFYRVEEHSPGLGVGLAIVRAIMKAHDGSVAVTSGGLGEGCIFTLKFPLSTTKLESTAKLPADFNS